MNLEKKLREWRTAEVIDQETEDRILEFETRSKSGTLLYALGGLGALTVGIGIISIVAANWELIPYQIKLAIDILFAIALASAIYWADVRGQNWLKETFLAIFYIYILGSIGLIGQIYQLGSPPYQALLLWTFCTVPIVLFGRSRFLAVLWICGLTLTYGLAVEPLHDALNLDDSAMLALIYLWPFVLLLTGSIKTLKDSKPAYVRAFITFGVGGLLLLGSYSQLFWVTNVSEENINSIWGPAFAFIVTAGFIGALKYLYPNVSSRGIGTFKTILSFNFLTSFAPLIFAHGGLHFIGAMSFIILWCLIGWAALQVQMPKLFDFATTLIGLRILVGYLEVFGSLLLTGVGMITGGSFILFLTWLWFKKSPRLREYLEQKAR